MSGQGEEWIAVDRPWHEYPEGTLAEIYGGGLWVRTGYGWRWMSGEKHPTPGGTAIGRVYLPVTAGGHLELNKEKDHER